SEIGSGGDFRNRSKGSESVSACTNLPLKRGGRLAPSGAKREGISIRCSSLVADPHPTLPLSGGGSAVFAAAPKPSQTSDRLLLFLRALLGRSWRGRCCGRFGLRHLADRDDLDLLVVRRGRMRLVDELLLADAERD